MKVACTVLSGGKPVRAYLSPFNSREISFIKDYPFIILNKSKSNRDKPIYFKLKQINSQNNHFIISLACTGTVIQFKRFMRTKAGIYKYRVKANNNENECKSLVV
jgi:hypothetical protein